MVTLYEYYNTNDDSAGSFDNDEWICQTFTPATAHTIQQVKLKMYRSGTPGTITVSIRATSADKPTGADLTSGTINGDTLTTDTAGAWYTITVTDYALSAGTKYAIVIRSTNAGSLGYCRDDVTSPTYAGGSYGESSDSGVTWTMNTNKDFMFEEWGVPSGLSKDLAATMSLHPVVVLTLITPKGVEKLIYIPDLGVFGIELD